eukprot:TRINITY_DN1509_c0_g1_i10.p4 TRINITY_DN1509_c0_g1~~TRINITY_DN1509_c0_g1_i10.p4  ORF type:complete len:112 (+),score=50.49 TRINITY_DN1509_c0_g1_i10:108-443(+)
MTAEQATFATVKEQLREVVLGSIEAELKGKEYSAKEGPTYAHQISESVIKQLPEKSKDFKYSVSCIILNKSEGGLHMSSSCFWNASTDGNIVERWENETMYCIVTLFAFAL